MLGDSIPYESVGVLSSTVFIFFVGENFPIFSSSSPLSVFKLATASRFIGIGDILKGVFFFVGDLLLGIGDSYSSITASG